MLIQFLHWLPAALWAALIFALSSRPSVPTPGFPDGDKILHFGAYTILGFLLAYGARRSALGPTWVVVIGLLYAASDEWHQSFVPGRMPDVTDWIADAFGVAAGVWVAGLRPRQLA